MEGGHGLPGRSRKGGGKGPLWPIVPLWCVTEPPCSPFGCPRVHRHERLKAASGWTRLIREKGGGVLIREKGGGGVCRCVGAAALRHFFACDAEGGKVISKPSEIRRTMPPARVKGGNRFFLLLLGPDRALFLFVIASSFIASSYSSEGGNVGSASRPRAHPFSPRFALILSFCFGHVPPRRSRNACDGAIDGAPCTEASEPVVSCPVLPQLLPEEEGPSLLHLIREQE